MLSKLATALLVAVLFVNSSVCDDKVEQPKVQKTVVSSAVKNKDMQMRHPIVRIRTSNGAGSGTIVYSEDRETKGDFKTFIITNHHVINSAVRIEKKWNSLKQKFEDVEVLDRVNVDIFRYKNGAEDGTIRYEADIISYDADDDLALVQLVTTNKIDNVAKVLTPNDEYPRVFEKVFAVGCSLAQSPIPSEGLLTNASITMERKKFWMVSANIYFGNSGGALFIERDNNYYWAGVPCAVAVSQQQVVSHMAYVIPLDRINAWIDAQKLSFLTDKNKTPTECFKEREKASEKK